MLTNSSDQAPRRWADSLGITEWLIKSETRPTELGRRISSWFMNR
jgi:hypothetical protein